MDNFVKNIKNWPNENLMIFSHFLEQAGKTITYEEVAKILGLKPEEITDKEGKSIGGILSTLKRNKYDNEPLIVSLGKLLGTRRLQWRLNNKVFTQDVREQLLSQINKILRERETFE